jgi:hypothetical protein
MPQSIHIIHYDVTISNNLLTGNSTTITSDPPATPTDAADTLIRSILTTAPDAIVTIRGVKEIDPGQYDALVQTLRV